MPDSTRIDRVAVDWLDRVAVGASFACLVHCLALPLLIAALPALSRVLAVPESFHLWVLAFAIPSSAIALGIGHLRHDRAGPLLIGIFGLVLLAAGAVLFGGTDWETPLTTLGSVSLALAHVANWRLRHACPPRT